MRFHVLATDYDGTIAHHGRVDERTVASLKRLLASGRRLVLVTGRELPELLTVLPEIDLFEWVVAENGGLLYRPATREEIPLGEAPPPRFVEVLTARGVGPISVGRSIVATWEPHEKTVLETIRDLGLELQVIFNKGAVMILPAGVNKASGLRAALDRMGVSPHNVVGVGDAENDHALLKGCEIGAAVENALPSVKATADVVLSLDHGAGVSELIDRMVTTDLAAESNAIERHQLPLGETDGAPVSLSPYGHNVLICGPSASGKSTVATRIVESLLEKGYQFCLVDPEGDYSSVEGPTHFGGPDAPPVPTEVIAALERPQSSAVVTLTGMSIADRPPLFTSLLSPLLDLRGRTGHPHWLLLDEAHHLMPADWKRPEGLLPERLVNFLLITVHPELLAPSVLKQVDTFIAVGPTAGDVLKQFAGVAKLEAPSTCGAAVSQGEVLLWDVRSGAVPRRVKVTPARTERRRHRRKYAEGDLPEDRSFYFTGPEKKMRLRAQNLMLFNQLGEGVDDETWSYHLRRGEYSQWCRTAIKDESLAAAVAAVEQDEQLSPQESRERVRAAIEADYTVPASPPLPVPGAG